MYEKRKKGKSCAKERNKSSYVLGVIDIWDFGFLEFNWYMMELFLEVDVEEESGVD